MGGFAQGRNGGFYLQIQGDIILFSSSTVCKERIMQCLDFEGGIVG
jgi:hypothetical protein